LLISPLHVSWEPDAKFLWVIQMLLASKPRDFDVSFRLKKHPEMLEDQKAGP
jgi:hypothetical protein